MKPKEGIEIIGWIVCGLLLLLGTYFVLCALRDHDDLKRRIRFIPNGIATHDN